MFFDFKLSQRELEILEAWKKKSDSGIVLNQRNFYHKILMTCILKQLSDTPLVLKWGTALYVGCYR